MEKQRVLFVCIHNSARSQMAEAFLNHLAGDRFEAKSAGLEPGILNPLAVAAMAEEGIDISANLTKDVFSMVQQGELFNYVITVCDGANAERCPYVPGVTNRLHWGFEDPSGLQGTEQEKHAATCRIRDEIKAQVERFIAETQEERNCTESA